jgi:hypothetical protein
VESGDVCLRDDGIHRFEVHSPPSNYQCIPAGLTPPTNPNTTGQNIYLLDPPGTVIDIPPGEGQRQADTLKQLCNGNAGQVTCSFKPSKQEDALSGDHPVGQPVVNNGNNPASFSVAVADQQSESNSVNIASKAGGKVSVFGNEVNVEISAAYGHTWTDTHTFTQTINVPLPPHCKGWIHGVTPVYRVTGDFTASVGNTTWKVREVYFDSPNPAGSGAYQIDTEVIPPQANLKQSPPIVEVSNVYAATDAAHQQPPRTWGSPATQCPKT